MPAIGFPRAAGRLIDGYAAATGVTAVGLDAGVPLAQAREIQKAVPVQGNLDPILLAAGGPALAERIVEIRTGLAGGPHIFNLGHGIVPQTPPDHVAELVATLRGAAA